MVRIDISTSDQCGLELEALNIPFEREYRFHPKRRWRFDFAYPISKLAVEVEGGIWAKDNSPPCPCCGQRQAGAHGRGKGIERDIEKYNEAVALGWRVLRVTDKNVATIGTLVGKALDQIARGAR